MKKIARILPDRGATVLIRLGYLSFLMIVEPAFGNERCSIIENPPVASGLLSQRYPPSISLQAKFQTALGNALTNRLPSGAGVGGELMATMIADYIDIDNIPKRLNMPSTEMVPMVSQILVPSFMEPTVVRRDVFVVGSMPPRIKTIYSVQMIANPNAAFVDVELVWPFKNHENRTSQPEFLVEVKGYLKVIKQHAEMKSRSFTDVPALPAYVSLNGSAEIPDYWSTDTSVPGSCYKHIMVQLTTSYPSGLIVDLIDSEDGAVNGFVEGQPFSVALVVFVYVKAGSAIVDSVPQLVPYPGLADPVAEFIITPKIFFQTVASAPLQRTMQVNQPIPYEWSSLEVPDPRFNYKASNWVKNTVDVNSITPMVNPSTLALLGTEGRDGDIYMSVSDSGVMQSPGELGFIVRPFPHDPVGANTDFRTQDSGTKAEDQAYMFRTIRLYDHGESSDTLKCERDYLYDFFRLRNLDGYLPGRISVNPRSVLPQELLVAVQDTPVDFYWAGKKAMGAPTVTFKGTLNAASWGRLTNAWLRCLQNATASPPFNASLGSRIADVYGRHDLFGWYSANDVNTVFQTSPGFAQALTQPLYEIDRKMLYSYSLDNFLDRPQFFLFMICAEETAPLGCGGRRQSP